MTAELIIANTGLKSEITERERMEQALHHSEELFHAAFIDAPNGMALLTPEGRFLQVNRTLCELFGYPEQELLATTFRILAHPEDQQSNLVVLQDILAGKVSYYQRENRCVHKNGDIIWVLVNVSLARDAQQQPMYLILQIQNITARKQAETALQQEREVTSAILDNTSAPVIARALEGRIVRFNQASEKLSGYAVWEATGVPVWDLLLPPDEVATFREILVNVQQEAVSRMHEHTWNTKNGEARRILWSYGVLYSQARTVEYVIAIGVDVTEQRRLETQLTLAQKMESIGQIAAGIAHEINTPLQYLGDNIRFLQDAFGDLDTLLMSHARLLAATKAGAVTAELMSEVEADVRAADYEYLSAEIPQAIQQTLQGITHVATIVRAMKEFSHPGAAEKSDSDLNRAIETTITIARNEWKYVAELTTDLDPTLPLVPCLLGEFNQVILNLILNAVHAIEDVVGDGSNGKGSITISTRRDGNWVEIRIRDTGRGIPEAIRARIFDLFFTTKGVGKGTGQGLAMAHVVVVKKHQGTLAFETEMGKGTTFIVRLPLPSSSLQQKDFDEKAHSLCG